MNGLKAFLTCYPIKRYEKGECIIRQDEEPKNAFLVKKGAIKSYNITSKGEEKLIQLNTRHDIFPLGWVFDKIRRSQYYYEAVKESEIYRIPRDELVTFLKNNTETMYQLLRDTVNESLHDQLRLNALEQSKAVEKICSTLHYLALRFGRDIQRDTVEITMPLTQQDVANFTGLTRETVSTEFKRLAAQDVLIYNSTSYTVRTDRLNELIDDDFDYGFTR